MQEKERTPSIRQNRYHQDFKKPSGVFFKTFIHQTLICLLLFLFCVFIKLSPETEFVNTKNAIRCILNTNTNPTQIWKKITDYFSKEDSLDALDPVSSMVAPSSGKIVKGFGMQDAKQNDFHYGAEISAGEKENIVAVNDGEVIEIAKNDEYGSFLIIRHSEEVHTLYGHLNEILPNVGEKVAKAQPIARAGGENPTFYFELRRGDTYLNPAEFITFGETDND